MNPTKLAYFKVKKIKIVTYKHSKLWVSFNKWIALFGKTIFVVGAKNFSVQQFQ